MDYDQSVWSVFFFFLIKNSVEQKKKKFYREPTCSLYEELLPAVWFQGFEGFCHEVHARNW